MALNNKKKLGAGWYVLFVVMGLTDLGLIIKKIMHGHNVALFNPQGQIAKQQHSLMLFTALVLLAVAVPTIILVYFFVWKYHETNTNTTAPAKAHKKKGHILDFSVWAIPTAVMLLLALVMWPATHKLEPQKAIASNVKPLKIQVVSLRWKWLFLYPEQHIATINYVQIPVGTPVEFELTADEAPMSSFWIPNLGGQLYTMTGMVNHLNLKADAIGEYPGSSAELNGEGFADMKFMAKATNSSDFDAWVAQVKQATSVLDADQFATIEMPTKKEPIVFYSSYDSTLYDKVLMKYRGPGGHDHS